MKHVIIVGSDTPEEIHKELILRAKELQSRAPEGSEISVLNLVDFEMQKIISTRLKFERELDLQKQLEDAEKRKQLSKDVETFINRVRKTTETPTWFKNQTNLSWKQFDSFIETLILFGFAKRSSNGKLLTFILDENRIKQNIIDSLNDDLDSILEKIRIMKHKFSKKELTALNNLEKKLKIKLHVENTN